MHGHAWLTYHDQGRSIVCMHMMPMGLARYRLMVNHQAISCYACNACYAWWYRLQDTFVNDWFAIVQASNDSALALLKIRSIESVSSLYEWCCNDHNDDRVCGSMHMRSIRMIDGDVVNDRSVRWHVSILQLSNCSSGRFESMHHSVCYALYIYTYIYIYVYKK